MANDSRLFRTERELTDLGCYRVAPHRWKRGQEEYVALYEGKMVQAFDHRAADITVVAGNLFRPGQQTEAGPEQHRNSNYAPKPRYFVDVTSCRWPEKLQWSIAIKDITSATNTRSIIAAIIPFSGAGHTLPLLFPKLPKPPSNAENPDELAVWLDAIETVVAAYKRNAPLLLANLGSFPADYLIRQKILGNHLAWFLMEQLPTISPDQYERSIGQRKCAELVRGEVLGLTYTAHDLAAFARDQGHDGPPFAWDEEDRRHRRARLDALYFMLYGIDEADADHVLSTFPIVRRQDEEAFGRYRTRDLILGYMRAFMAGDADSRIDG